jgi:hypothetical protein
MRLTDLLERTGIHKLDERRIQNTEIVYHGTSDRFLRGILKQGLMANPPERTYSPGYDPGHETFGGVYVANGRWAAKNAANAAVDRFGGDGIILVIQYVQGSGNLDEDIFTRALAQSIEHSMNAFYDDQKMYPDELGQYETFDDYALANRERVVSGMVEADMEHFSRYGRLGKPVMTTLRTAYNYILDNVEEDYHNIGGMMRILRSREEFVRLIEILMRNVFPTKDRDANDIAFQITRDIGFRGKTKIVRIEDMRGVPVWENPNSDSVL